MAPHTALMAAQQLTSLISFSHQIQPKPITIHAIQQVQNKLMACSLAVLAICAIPAPSLASIPLSAPPPQEQQRRALSQLGVATRRPETSNLTNGEEPVSKKVERVMSLMAEASEAAQSNDWQRALECESEIIQRYPDLALAERARIARALLLYQVGRTDDALLQLEDEEVALRGSAEVHAALAVIFYDLGKPVQAEQQWTVASEFDSRYSDVSWVQNERHWPPKLIEALKKFLTLS